MADSSPNWPIVNRGGAEKLDRIIRELVAELGFRAETEAKRNGYPARQFSIALLLRWGGSLGLKLHL